MKELRFKVSEEIYNKIKAEADLTHSFPTVIAKNIFEASYNVGTGVFVKMDDDMVKAVQRSAHKKDLNLGDFVKEILDKVLPTDTMRTIMFRCPKSLKGKELTEWFSKKIDELVKQVN